MPYYSKEQIAQAREMDLLTYLQNFEPGELVHVTGNTYSTREHDSLKISNGKWMWWSRGFGGASALDFLVKVRGEPFIDAVGKILGEAAGEPPFKVQKTQQKAPPEAKKKLLLPERSPSSDRIMAYLTGRGISREIIQQCINDGLLYESLPYHNCIFVGFDNAGDAGYACFRGTVPEKIMGEAAGSDKRFSFRISGIEGCRELHLFESAIDLLSYATIQRERGADWRKENMLSLGGIYVPSDRSSKWKTPAALTNFLETGGSIREIVLHLDNDYPGRAASERLQQRFAGKYHIRDEPPAYGKDMNDELMARLRRREERRKARTEHER